MKKITITLAVVAAMVAGCAWTPPSKNPNIAPNPEKDAFKACMKKNNNDKDKCSVERKKYLERQEMDIMDNNG